VNSYPNYPMSTSAYDAEQYYGHRESSSIEMLEPTCPECSNEVISWGLMCDECQAGVPDMHECETPLSAVLCFAAAFVCFLMWVAVMVVASI